MRSSISLLATTLLFAALTSLNSQAQASFTTTGEGGFWGPALCENMHEWAEDIRASNNHRYDE